MFNQITQLIDHWGYAGIILSMFLENLFPPIPSELIMPMAGFEASRGALSLPLVIASGSAGSLFGALFWYLVGLIVDTARLKHWTRQHGRWLTLAPNEVDRIGGWFRRHGPTAVLLGRLVPTIRTLISLPAGIVRMRPSLFVFYSSIGILAWTSVLACAGYYLEDRYAHVSELLDPVINFMTVVIAGVYVYRLVAWQPE